MSEQPVAAVSHQTAPPAGKHDKIDRTQKNDELAIEALAKETSVSVDKVRELYMTEHARLTAHARIKTFVSVFAARLVRSALYETKNISLQ